MDSDRMDRALMAITRVCEGVLADQARWSSDAVIVAKALLALTRDTNRQQMYPDETWRSSFGASL